MKGGGMADITRRLFLRHLRGAPTTWVRHFVRGKVRHEGIGQSFWYRPLTAVLSEVPVDDRELPLLFHARTSDFADVTVQATVTYRVADPDKASSRLDFSIDPARGTWRAKPLDQIASVRDAVSAALREDERLTDTGVGVVSARVVAIRPEPELERALQTPTREQVQQDADAATYERRAKAVERERAIAENELQNKIELARREQQLVEQAGANARRQAELNAEALRVDAAGEAERATVAAGADAEAERLRAEAR